MLIRWIQNLVIRCLRWFCARVHIQLSEEKWHTLEQFVGFGIVGVSNTVLSYVINVLALLALSPFAVEWDYFAANAIAFFLSVLWSYYWNSKAVFPEEGGSRRSVWKTLLKTYVAYSVTGIFLNSFLLWLWVSCLGISKYIAPIINLLISVPLNFVLNKLWAFRQE